MSHNFRIIGNRHFAKSGHDSASGAPGEPMKTISFNGMSNGQVAVIGAGDFPTFGTTVLQITVKGDGKVIIRGGSMNSIGGSGGWPYDVELIGCTWIRESGSTGDPQLRTIFRGGTFTIRNEVNNGRLAYVNGMLFIGSTVNITSNLASVKSRIALSIYRSCTINIGSSVAITAGNCTLQNSDVDEGSLIVITSGRGAALVRNNIRGIVRVDGTDYELKRDKAGNTINTNPSIADLATAPGFSDVYTNGNFRQDPKYLYATAENFCLQADSPNIRAANDNVNNIGGYFAQVGIAVENTDDGNAAGVRVLASPEIDTTIPDAFRLKTTPVNGLVPIAGYVDYVFPSSGLTIAQLKIADLFQFDSDFDSTSGIVYTQNNNVVDAQPEQRSGSNANTTGYAARTAQIGNAANATTLNIPAGLGAGAVVTGMMVRVNGQVRTISAVSAPDVSNNVVVTVSSAFAAAITNGTIVTYGTSSQIAALTPNRLTVLMRTRSSTVAPTIGIDGNGYPTYVDSEWDNELSGAYGVNGRFFQQEIDQKPGLIIQGVNVWGTGDSDAPTGITPQDLAPRWVHIRVYKRNDYSSNGNPQ